MGSPFPPDVPPHLLPLILSWACVIAAIALSRFTLGEYLIGVTLTLLGGSTFNFHLTPAYPR